MVQDFCRRFLPAYINPYLDNPETSDTPSNSDIAAQAANPLAPDNFHFEMLWNDPQGSFADIMPNIQASNSSSPPTPSTTEPSNYATSASTPLPWAKPTA